MPNFVWPARDLPRMHRTALTLLLLTGCAAARPHVELQPLALTAPPLEADHFSRDAMGVSEEALREILGAPVFLEAGARIGVLPVGFGYATDTSVPVDGVPGSLADALEGSGLFELASEMSAEWPTTSGAAGLRELAARYRTEYVLLYRHRFADATHANGFAAGFVTLLGALVLPGTSIESEGVLEATLFDVKTGTILFTIHTRARREGMSVPPAVTGRVAEMHREMLAEGAAKLADAVLARCQRLVASRPANSAPQLSLEAPR